MSRENKKESRNSLPCEPAGARTQDPILKRDVLYLLSVSLERLFPGFFSKAGAKVLLFFDMTKYFLIFFKK